jgi:hypothetical protein
VVQVLFRGAVDPRIVEVHLEDGRKEAEKERRRELEAGYNSIKDVRQQRVRSLEDIIDEYLVGYRLRYRSATFAEHALGHVSRLLGTKLVVDVDEATVLGYQESRLREKAAPKTINEEVRFLLKMLCDPGELIRARLRKKKQLKLAVGRHIGKAFDSEETERLIERARLSKSSHMYLTDLVRSFFSPRAWCALERDSQLREGYVAEEECDCDRRAEGEGIAFVFLACCFSLRFCRCRVADRRLKMQMLWPTVMRNTTGNSVP